MKNISNTIIYGLIGAVIGTLFPLTTTNYIGNLDTDFTEGISFILMIITPIIITLGTILGIIYARKYKK